MAFPSCLLSDPDGPHGILTSLRDGLWFGVSRPKALAMASSRVCGEAFIGVLSPRFKGLERTQDLIHSGLGICWFVRCGQLTVNNSGEENLLATLDR